MSCSGTGALPEVFPLKTGAYTNVQKHLTKQVITRHAANAAEVEYKQTVAA